VPWTLSRPRAEELASRRDDAWGPKLDRRAALAHSAGAATVVFGHTHIPMSIQHRGALLVNPGALASANVVGRQRLKTVALLFVRVDGAPVVVHVDLAAPDQVFAPHIDWDAGYKAALDNVNASILSPALGADWERLAPHVRALSPEQRRSLLLPLAHRCWNDERELITHADVFAALHANTSIPDTTCAELAAVLSQGYSRR